VPRSCAPVVSNAKDPSAGLLFFPDRLSPPESTISPARLDHCLPLDHKEHPSSFLILR